MAPRISPNYFKAHLHAKGSKTFEHSTEALWCLWVDKETLVARLQNNPVTTSDFRYDDLVQVERDEQGGFWICGRARPH